MNFTQIVVRNRQTWDYPAAAPSFLLLSRSLKLCQLEYANIETNQANWFLKLHLWTVSCTFTSSTVGRRLRRAKRQQKSIHSTFSNCSSPPTGLLTGWLLSNWGEYINPHNGYQLALLAFIILIIHFSASICRAKHIDRFISIKSLNNHSSSSIFSSSTLLPSTPRLSIALQLHSAN